MQKSYKAAVGLNILVFQITVDPFYWPHLLFWDWFCKMKGKNLKRVN